MVKLAMGYLLIFLVMMQARLSSGQSSTTDLPSAATGGGPPAGNDPTARNNGFKGARKFPLCITKELVEEYRGELKRKEDQDDLIKFIDTFDKQRNQRVVQAACPGCPAGLIQQVKYYQINTNLKGRFQKNEYRRYQFLGNWIHLEIRTEVPVTQLVVQGLSWPQGMSWGVFDLEFAGTDCGSEYNIHDTNDGDALTLDGRAGVMPCRRRSYIHRRHPSVYVFSSSSKPRREFHINFNVDDMTCFEVRMLQFMFLVGAKSTVSLVKSAVIDHYLYAHGLAGEPFPFHTSIAGSITAHSQLLNFIMVTNGDVSDFPINKDYDDCIREPNTANIIDTAANYVSDWVCKKPSRHKCSFKSEIVAYNRKDDINADGSPALCRECTNKDNEFTRENVRRLIQRTYGARRFHGYAMILGSVHLMGFSNFAARYLKESKGSSCLLVGSWMWAHLVCAILTKGLIWVGVVLVVFMPPRRGERELVASDSREVIIGIHHLVGTVATVMFTLSSISGFIRPRNNDALRNKAIVAHTVCGHGTVLFGIISVAISTACTDIKLLTCIAAVLGLVLYAVAWFSQIRMDRRQPLVPPRKYFPVIEAVKVSSGQGGRLALLGLYGAITVGIFLLTASERKYEGFIVQDPCKNCVYKYDENIRVESNPTDQSTTAVVTFFSMFSCNLTDISYSIF